MIGVGWFVALSILLGVLAGHWLDGVFGTGPILVVVGLLGGLGIAFFGLYRMLRAILKDK